MHARLPTLVLIPILAGLAPVGAGCGGRPAANGADAAAAPTTDAGSCEFPDGTCDFDGDCAPDERCIGALHTVGAPHAFVCRGKCQPKAPPSVPPPPPPPCDPAAEPQLSVELTMRADGRVTARVTNVGCVSVYHMQGCCAEGLPLIEALGAGGAWDGAKCSQEPTMCCDAMPTCVELAPQASYDVEVGDLSARLCCGTTFRVAFGLARDPGCIDDMSKPALVVRSNALKLRDVDLCDAPTPSGTPCGGSVCDANQQVCVRLETQTGYQWQCRPLPAQCASDRSCACVGKGVCTSPYYSCSDMPSLSNTVGCGCPNC